MIIKDLLIEDKDWFLEISGFVLLKRQQKWYTVPVRVRFDYPDPKHLVQCLRHYKDVMGQFMDMCERTSEHYKILDPVPQNAAGFTIHQEEFKFEEYG